MYQIPVENWKKRFGYVKFIYFCVFQPRFGRRKQPKLGFTGFRLWVDVNSIIFISIIEYIITNEAACESCGYWCRCSPTHLLTHSLTYSIVNSGDSVGYILFKKLLKRKQFYPIGLVRDNASYRKLIKEGKQFRTFLLSSYYLHTIP